MREDTSLKDHDVAVKDDASAPLQPGRIFQWLYPRDPTKARRRFGKLFWRAWKRLVLSFFLSVYGVTFFLIGGACVKMCDEADRGFAFVVVGCILMMPGFYGMITLLQYVRCAGRRHYKELPDYD
jgi:hypothetical protein